ncbi:hypothetical protein [Oerskovia flava]|uniref:hypothetical protein n=1 Tax=Oerskovia flava TaxID=2986422 RepID=UPI00223FC8CD|nr:hypothetical protein [Oerskovia sp. JB1-3-2]
MPLLVYVGSLLLLAGLVLAGRVLRRSPQDESTGAHGLVLALGLSLVAWGAIALVVALATAGP